MKRKCETSLDKKLIPHGAGEVFSSPHANASKGGRSKKQKCEASSDKKLVPRGAGEVFSGPLANASEW